MASNLISDSGGGHSAASAIFCNISIVIGSVLDIGFAICCYRPANVALTMGLFEILTYPGNCCSKDTAFTASSTAALDPNVVAMCCKYRAN